MPSVQFIQLGVVIGSKDLSDGSGPENICN